MTNLTRHLFAMFHFVTQLDIVPFVTPLSSLQILERMYFLASPN